MTLFLPAETRFAVVTWAPSQDVEELQVVLTTEFYAPAIGSQHSYTTTLTVGVRLLHDRPVSIVIVVHHNPHSTISIGWVLHINKTIVPMGKAAPAMSACLTSN